VIRVVLADDHPVVREGMKASLEKEPGIRVVGEASNGEEAIQLVKEEEPQVAIFDIKMPPLNGIEAMKRVLKECPDTRVIILTAYISDPYLDAARHAGASGFLDKHTSSEQCRLAVRAVAQGGTFFSEEAHRRLMQREKGKYNLGDRIVEALTQKELDALLLVAMGDSNKKIAEKLGLDARGAQARLRNINLKLGVNSRTAAVSMALREHWIDLEAEEILLPGKPIGGEKHVG
jgi:DNA-binding NarL/FixJ family response regulator